MEVVNVDSTDVINGEVIWWTIRLNSFVTNFFIWIAPKGGPSSYLVAIDDFDALGPNQDGNSSGEKVIRQRKMWIYRIKISFFHDRTFDYFSKKRSDIFEKKKVMLEQKNAAAATLVDLDSDTFELAKDRETPSCTEESRKDQ